MDFDKPDESEFGDGEFERDPSFDADDIMSSAVDETPDVLGSQWDGGEPDLSELAEPDEESYEPDAGAYPDEGGEIKDDIADDDIGYSDDGGGYPDADSYDQGDIDEAMENDGAEKATDEELERFVAVEKESYESASEKKPGRLNKKIILNTVVMFATAILLLTVFMPESCKQRKNSSAKKNGRADDVTMQDFRSMATSSDRSKGRDARKKGKKSKPVLGEDGHWYDEDGNIVDDLVNEGYYGNPETLAEESAQPERERKQTETPPPAQTAQGTYIAEERPDTRGDSLQIGISGIKGITGTRANYMTDYGTTREANARASMKEGLQQYQLPDLGTMQDSILAAVKTNQGMSNYRVQNDQEGKQGFHSSGSERAGEGEWRPKNSLWEGSVFEAELTTALNTDLPGEITARVTKNVYSSQTGEYLLIPQNSILYGTYNSSISYSQSRAQIAWNKIIRPDGYVINLGNFNAVDRHGAAGVRGFVNDHPLAYLKAIAVMSVFNIINREFETSLDGVQNEYAQNVMANSQEVANTLGEKLIDRAMDVQPTITKNAGTILYVLTNQPLTLPPVETPPVTQPYQRKWGWQK